MISPGYVHYAFVFPPTQKKTKDEKPLKRGRSSIIQKGRSEKEKRVHGVIKNYCWTTGP